MNMMSLRQRVGLIGVRTSGAGRPHDLEGFNLEAAIDTLSIWLIAVAGVPFAFTVFGILTHAPKQVPDKRSIAPASMRMLSAAGPLRTFFVQRHIGLVFDVVESRPRLWQMNSRKITPGRK
jgi:hypothetical protein